MIRLRQALSNDHALEYTDLGVVTSGWMSIYVKDTPHPICYISDLLESCLTIKRNDRQIDSHDEQDMRIIGRQSGYYVQIDDECITFTSTY